MSSAKVRQLDPGECESLVQSLDDTPEMVIVGHQLRHGLCTAYAEGGSSSLRRRGHPTVPPER